MNKLQIIALAAVTAALVSLVTLWQHGGTPASPAAPTTSVYQGVVNRGTLRCGYVNWKPYYYVDLKDGNQQASGLNYDIMVELGKVLDLKIEWVEEVGWGNIGAGFATRRYDAVCTSMWPDSAKFKNLSLSIPIFFTAPRLYARQGDSRFDGNLANINQPDVKIVVIDGSSLIPVAKGAYPNAQFITLPQLTQEAEYYMTVSARKADIALADPDEIKGYLASNPDQLKLIPNIPPLRVMPLVLAFPPNDPQFSAMMNTGLQVLIDNGVMAAIRKKYETNYLPPAVGFQP